MTYLLCHFEHSREISKTGCNELFQTSVQVSYLYTNNMEKFGSMGVFFEYLPAKSHGMIT